MNYDETLVDIFRKIKFSKDEDIYATEEQIQILSSLTIDDVNPFFSYNKNLKERIKDKSFIYEFLALRIDNNYSIEKIINEIKEIVQTNYISRSKILFEAGGFFIKEKDNYLADIERLKGVMEVSEGLERCPGCRSMKTVSINMQIRAGDEGTDSLNKCYACGKEWRTRG